MIWPDLLPPGDACAFKTSFDDPVAFRSEDKKHQQRRSHLEFRWITILGGELPTARKWVSYNPNDKWIFTAPYPM